MLYKMIMLIVGVAILYGTGWNMALGLEISSMLSKIIASGGIESIFSNIGATIFADSTLVPDYLFNGDFAVINFNNLFYGFFNTHRFFSSSMVEWVGLGAGIMALWTGITASTQDDELVMEQ